MKIGIGEIGEDIKVGKNECFLIIASLLNIYYSKCDSCRLDKRKFNKKVDNLSFSFWFSFLKKSQS